MATNNAINLSSSGLSSYDGSSTFNGRTITGDTAFIDITNGDGVSANPNVDITSNFESTGMHGWNGSIIQPMSLTVTSDGATITASVEQDGGGDLVVVFSDGYDNWDTTPPDTVTLTAGTDTTPMLNFVFYPQSTKTLTANTTGFPTAEHAAIGTVICQSAGSLQTNGAYKVHEWMDDLTDTNDQGHVPHINAWIRKRSATWENGVAPTLTITTNVGVPDNVIFTSTSGTVSQLHPHTFPAFAGTPDVYTVNDSVTPFNIVTDLNLLLTDSTGGSMAGRRFSLVIWGVQSESTGDCKLMVNLPSGTYGTNAAVTADDSKFANFSIPSNFTGTGFLIAQYNLRQQGASGGTWSIIDEIDLRGLFPAVTAGSGTVAGSEFDDSVFRIFDDGDNSKEIAFQASPITTATTRTITMVDSDLDLADVVQGPGSATDQALARYDTTTGKLLQDSTVIVTDAGEMTNASQPAFAATLNSTDSNVTGDGTTYKTGTTVAWTERFDQNSDFNTNGTFTAPVTGQYFFSIGIRFGDLTTSFTKAELILATSNISYFALVSNAGAMLDPGNQTGYGVSFFTDMDAADTTEFVVAVSGSTKTIDLVATSWFQGVLIC